MMRYSLLVLFGFTMGCIKPYKKIHPSYDSSINYSGVLVNATVDATGLMSSGEDDSAVANAVQSAIIIDALKPFGESVVPQALPYWKQEGFTVVTDEARVSKEMSEGMENFAKFLNTTSGIWIHPETAMRYRVGNNTLLLKRTRDKMVETFDTEVKDEAFVFTYVSFSKRTKLFVKHYPVVVFDTVVLGEQGQYLYRSRGVGNGDTRLFLINLSQENLSVGFKAALDSLENAETTIVDK